MERRLLILVLVVVCAITFFALVGAAHASFTVAPYSTTRVSIWENDALVYPFHNTATNYFYRVRVWYWPIGTTGAPTSASDTTNISTTANNRIPNTPSHVVWPYAAVNFTIQSSLGWGDPTNRPNDDIEDADVDAGTEGTANMYDITQNPLLFTSAERWPGNTTTTMAAHTTAPIWTVPIGSWYWVTVMPYVNDCVFYLYIQRSTDGTTWSDLTSSFVPTNLSATPGRYVGKLYSGSGFQWLGYTQPGTPSYQNDAYMQQSLWFPGYLSTGGGTSWGTSVWSTANNTADVSAQSGSNNAKRALAPDLAGEWPSDDIVYEYNSGWTPVPITTDTGSGADADHALANISQVSNADGGDSTTEAPIWTIHEPQIWNVAWRGLPAPTYTPAVPGGAPATYANIWPLWTKANVSPYDYPQPGVTTDTYAMGPNLDGSANAWFNQWHAYMVYGFQQNYSAAPQVAYYPGSVDSNATETFSGNNLTGFGGMAGVTGDRSTRVHITALQVNAGSARSNRWVWYASKGPYGGYAYVYLNQTFQHDPTVTPAAGTPSPTATISLYNATDQDNVPVYTISPLPANTNSIDIMGWDMKAAAQSTPAGSGGTFVYHDAYTVGPDTITATDWQASPGPQATATTVSFPNLRFENNTDGQTQYYWPVLQGSYNRVGTTYPADVSWCSSTRSACALAFQGTSITYFYVKEPTGGTANVYIDGVLMGQVNEYNASELTNQSVTYNTFASTSTLGNWHMILIRNSGIKGGGGGYRIFLDGFAVPSGASVTLDN